MPVAAKSIPGVWGHIMTFLGGSRGCIGYRFALFECVLILPAYNTADHVYVPTLRRMKALLFAMVRTFEFELTVPAEEVATMSTIVTRPCLRSERGAGPQLPLKVNLIEP